MTGPDFQLACDVIFDVAVDGLSERAVQTLVAASLFEAGAQAGDVIEVGVTFCDEERIAGENLTHRDVKGATDVLSFPIDGIDEQLREHEPRMLGDVLICPAYVDRQLHAGTTMQHDTTQLRAIERCIVHGALHLCGFDHERGDAAAAEMEALEQLVLDRVRGAATG